MIICIQLWFSEMRGSILSSSRICWSYSIFFYLAMNLKLSGLNHRKHMGNPEDITDFCLLSRCQYHMLLPKRQIPLPWKGQRNCSWYTMQTLGGQYWIFGCWIPWKQLGWCWKFLQKSGWRCQTLVSHIPEWLGILWYPWMSQWVESHILSVYSTMPL